MSEKLTIVGPEPTSPGEGESTRQLKIETVLLMAKYDADFRARLLADRARTLADTKLDLSRGEMLLLTSVSEEQLAQNIHTFRLPGVSKKSLSSWAKAAAVLLFLSSLALTDFGCDSATRPDKPVTGSAPDDTTHIETYGIGPDDDDTCRGLTADE